MSKPAPKAPFNVKILDMEAAKVKNLRQVSSMAIYEGATTALHPEGIFSTTIFGRVGSDDRNKIFGRIEIPVKVFDPTIYTFLMSLKSLYGDIINEAKYAKFDEELKDFVAADPTVGDTGYDFFMKHWKKIDFTRNKSNRRGMKIDLIEKYKDVSEIKRFVILPAGLRDIEINDQGRLEENEVNEMYRKILAYARLLGTNDTDDRRLLNSPRRFLQRALQELWQYLFELFGGKGGFFYEKAASRRLFDGTRNVITALDTVRSHIGNGEGLSINELTVGVLQTAKGCRPLTIGLLRRQLTAHVFDPAPTVQGGRLIDPKTLESVRVDVPFAVKDRWLSKDGLGKVVESYREVSVRKLPLMIQDHYVALVYEDATSFKLFWDIKDLPEDLDRANVRPATLTDVLVITCKKEWERRFSFPARYPIAGGGSTFPARFRVITTVPDKTLRQRNDDWSIPEVGGVFTSFPDYAGKYYDSMSLHPAMLAGAAADHDGDTSSNNYVLSDEAIVEMEGVLNSARFYLSPGGGYKRTMDYYTLSLITHNMNL